MKRHIVYLTTFYPKEDKPWHGIFFRDHARALVEFEQVTVLHLETPSMRSSGLAKAKISLTKKQNLLEIYVSQPVLTHRFRSLTDRAYQKAAQKALKLLQRKPDLLIAQCVLPAGNIAKSLSETMAIPYGTIEHFTFLERMVREQGDEIKRVYDTASFVGCVSDQMKRIIDPLVDPSKVLTTYNVIGREFENHEPAPIGSKSDTFRWLFVGPDVEKKGIDTLADALKALEQSNSNSWKITIVGKGSFDKIRKLGLEQKVTFITGVNRAEMLNIINNHHALISTSRLETFGMAIVEMLSQGRPVVATVCGGPEEYMQDFCGKLIGKEKPAEAAEAMLELMDSYSTFDSSRIRSYIIKNFGSDAFYSKMKQLFAKSGLT